MHSDKKDALMLHDSYAKSLCNPTYYESKVLCAETCNTENPKWTRNNREKKSIGKPSYVA